MNHRKNITKIHKVIDFHLLHAIIWCLALLGLTACENPPVKDIEMTSGDAIRAALIQADSGAMIELPAGSYQFERGLSLQGIPDVTIRGKGIGETILSFAEQIDGAEGILIKADGVTLEDFTVQNTKGDAIKIQDSKNVVLRGIETTWTDGANDTNGGYGLYPIACRNVLIEKCEASFASDAGIYVGQCSDVIVRDNYAHHNVAGIEIENSLRVDVYENLAEHNTGGILVFDLPDLPLANGGQVRVFNNISRSNNHRNFAPEGGMVATLPPGTGMLIIAHDDLEIFNNQILDYKTIGLGVISYWFTERPFNQENGFDPYYHGISVHDNTFSRRKAIPDLSKEFGKMLNGLFVGKPQDIVIDGIFDPESTMSEPSICLVRNGSDLRFANLNAETAEGLRDLRKLYNRDLSVFECELPPMQALIE